MKALEFERKEARFAAAMVASRLKPGAGAEVGPLSLAEIDPPALLGPGWQRVHTTLSGICGSDLDSIDAKSSRYFEPLVSFPFVMGHEILGRLDDGTRVVIEPVMGHEARNQIPPFPGAAPADGNDYGHLVTGHIRPGIQIGYCADTGGGWSEEFVAHESQIHAIPDELSDDDAVMVEPLASGIHAALRANVQEGDNVAVIGAGTLGLCTIAALRTLTPANKILVAAKYPHQRKIAELMGADVVVSSDELPRAIRRMLGCSLIGEALSSGVDVTIDGIASSGTITTAINITRPRGRVVMLGMPGQVNVDLTALWHRETEMVGTYTYGTETLADGSSARTFELAVDLAAKGGVGRLVTAHYPIEDYVEAVQHAAQAGMRGAVKVVFDFR